MLKLVPFLSQAQDVLPCCAIERKNIKLRLGVAPAMPAKRMRKREEEMSRSRDVSLCGPIARYGKFLGMELLASVLVLSVGHADKAGNGNGNGNDNGNGNGNGNNGELKNDRAVRLLTTVPIPGTA